MRKSANRLYFESKEESKMNQNKNIKIKPSRGVDNYYQDVKNHDKKTKVKKI